MLLVQPDSITSIKRGNVAAEMCNSKDDNRKVSRMAAKPVDMCRGECPGVVCCNTVRQSCGTPSAYVQASADVARCSEKRSPAAQSAMLTFNY